MTERVDPKLETAVVATYSYRHEAEFAAGFLDQADIPYWIQVADATMGISAGTSATIWVRTMDLDEARELLEVEESATGRGHASGSQESLPRTRERPPPALAAGSEPTRHRSPGGPPVASDPSRRALAPVGLSGRERIVALLLGGGVSGAAWLTVPSSPAAGGILATLGVLLGIGSLTGRTLRWLESLIRALSGSSP